MDIALMGIGYWGPNLLRVFSSMRGVRVKYVCDHDKKRISSFRNKYPDTIFTKDINEVLKDKAVKAVVISTPASTHFKLSKSALEKGKDVYVEKPIALKIKDAEELARISKKRKKILMVGHLLEYHPAISKLKSMIDNGKLGKIFYIDCNRLNLGRIRREENVLWSLAVHDISAVLYLLGKMPVSINAYGKSYLQKGVEDFILITLKFPDNILATIKTSWIHPRKVREMTIVGSRKMAVFDDVDPQKKLKILNKYIEKQRFASYDALPRLKLGKTSFFDISLKEPLKIECEHFIDCVKKRRNPVSGAQDGMRVVNVLHAGQDSLRLGKEIKIR